MQKYIIGTLVVAILALASIIYKYENASPPPPKRFPITEELQKADAEVPLFLFVFFSKHNCYDCMNFIKVLNNLPPHFIVRGVIPTKELKNIDELRHITGAEFPILGPEKFKDFVPFYTPTTIGVSPGGDILFTLPGVPGEKEYIENFLNSIYLKIYPVFLGFRNTAR